jgi:3-hydroxyacyl-CoA dehydrogenase/enoyl-CoA hydratase/3-hydroxybutyryl-CoA epimerase
VSSPGHWQLRVDDDQVAWLALDKQGATANSLSRDVMEELQSQLLKIERTKPRALIIHSAKDQGFITGADINEFVAIRNATEALPLIQQGQAVLDRLEALRFPRVADWKSPWPVAIAW